MQFRKSEETVENLKLGSFHSYSKLFMILMGEEWWEGVQITDVCIKLH